MADEQHSLQTYVSDMLALERHMRVPFETQRKDDDFPKYAQGSEIVSRLVALSTQHIDALEECLKRLGGHEASPVKSAVSSVEGVVAGAIDKMRKTKVAKSLRDDYTALALAAVGYTMLQTTALALNDGAVASLADRHLRDYAACIMTIGDALPAVVIQDLRDIGLTVDAAAAEQARRAAEEAWRAGAQASSPRL